MSDQANITWMDVLTKLMPVAVTIVVGFWAVLAFVMGGYKSNVDQLSVSVSSLEQRMDGRFGEMAGRFTDMENRFTNVDTNVAATERSLEDDMRTLKQQNEMILAQLQGLTVDFGDLRAKIDPTNYDPNSQPAAPSPQQLNLLDLPVASADPGYGKYRRNNSGKYGRATSANIDISDNSPTEEDVIGTHLLSPETMEDIASTLPEGVEITVTVTLDDLMRATSHMSASEEWAGWLLEFDYQNDNAVKILPSKDAGAILIDPTYVDRNVVTCGNLTSDFSAAKGAIQDMCDVAVDSDLYEFAVGG